MTNEILEKDFLSFVEKEDNFISFLENQDSYVLYVCDLFLYTLDDELLSSVYNLYMNNILEYKLLIKNFINNEVEFNKYIKPYEKYFIYYFFIDEINDYVTVNKIKNTFDYTLELENIILNITNKKDINTKNFDSFLKEIIDKGFNFNYQLLINSKEDFNDVE